jgi:hypothetical protein
LGIGEITHAGPGAGATGVINTAHCNAYREVEQRLHEGSDHSLLATQSLNELQRA